MKSSTQSGTCRRTPSGHQPTYGPVHTHTHDIRIRIRTACDGAGRQGDGLRGFLLCRSGSDGRRRLGRHPACWVGRVGGSIGSMSAGEQSCAAARSRSSDGSRHTYLIGRSNSEKSIVKGQTRAGFLPLPFVQHPICDRHSLSPSKAARVVCCSANQDGESKPVKILALVCRAHPWIDVLSTLQKRQISSPPASQPENQTNEQNRDEQNRGDRWNSHSVRCGAVVDLEIGR